VFDDAKAMVFASPALLQRGRALKRAIVTNQGSAYKVISADANTKHGYSPHGIIFDELHAQPNRDLYDTLRTGRGARRQPMEVYLTTAGYDRNSICWEVHEYAQRVLKKIVEDESFLAVIFSADETDDWKSPETWTKANPNLGISISEEYLQAECLRAQQSPAYENTFKRLHLNLWTSQSKRFIPMDAWDASSGEIDPIDLEGLPCYAGLDLSCTTDLTALVLVFPVGDEYKILPFFWCPQEGIVERSRRDGVRYDLWAQHGQLTSTEGNVIDYRSILKKLDELRKVYEIREIAYDRWGAPKISQELIEAGFKIIPFGQGFGSMSAPTKELLTLTLAKRMVHGGHPVLRWNMDNMVVRTDPAGNVKPDKEKARQRIDGAVALIMGLDRAQRNAAGGTSVYATRGIRTV
jgi:phage terminase large subunit-like protein